MKNQDEDEDQDQDEELHRENNLDNYRKCLPYIYSSRKCYLCRKEKMKIALYEGENLLNMKTELIFRYRHQNKFMLLHHDSKN